MDFQATAEEAFNERVRLYMDFLGSDHGENEYKYEIKRMLETGGRRLIVNIDHLRQYNRQTAENLVKNPLDFLPPFDRALRDYIASTQDQPAQKWAAEVQYYVGLKGVFGENHVNPRTLNSNHLGQFICIEGIVTRCSLVRPKVMKSVHWCEKTQMMHTREYRDNTSLGETIPTGAAYPTEDENGNPLTTEFGYCTYRNHQTFTIQEMPERAPAGQLPRSIDVIADDDLVDKFKPGDRIQLIGIYRTTGGKNSGSTSGTFKTVILANNVRLLEKEIHAPTITDLDVQNIRKIAKKKSAFELLSQSLAPSIHGHEYVKKAILLLLLGGMEKNTQNGTHIRGDINMLLLGDPSTAKSQFLRFVLNIAPLAVATTGRGSSGVGLTAAVTTDKETGERRLEAGAMVLADRGIVCIDEFDKMSEADRVAIHEVMEQQTITIAKAGIHTSLNARCSVIAAANPTYGQYDETLEPARNIRLPDSLLSRFDLLFIFLDRTNDTVDREISRHVVRMHRYIPPGVEEGTPIPDSSNSPYPVEVNEGEVRDTPVYEKFNKNLHGGVAHKKNKDLVTIGFLKKYIHYAKNRIKPALTAEASAFITQSYASLRTTSVKGTRKTLPITARTLETLIRLATAHAKVRLSNKVEAKDAQMADKILRYALLKDFTEKKTDDSDSDSEEERTENGPRKKKRRKDGSIVSDSESDDDDEISYKPKSTKSRPTPSGSNTQTSVAPSDVISPDTTHGDISALIDDDSQFFESVSSQGPSQVPSQQASEMAVDGPQLSGASTRSSLPEVDPARLRVFRSRLSRLFMEMASIPRKALLDMVNIELPAAEQFQADEAEACLHHMESSQQIMMDGGQVYNAV